MKFKLSVGVAYMAFGNLVALPWYVLLEDVRISDPKVVFAAAFWIPDHMKGNTFGTSDFAPARTQE